MTLRQQAEKVEAQRNECGKCRFFPCTERESEICSENFVKAWVKGYNKRNNAKPIRKRVEQ